MGSKSPESEEKAYCTWWEERGERCNGTYSAARGERGKLVEGKSQGLREGWKRELNGNPPFG